jgi:hypothetical protein
MQVHRDRTRSAAMESETVASKSDKWRRWARGAVALLLGFPSLAGALDFPAGYPTWYRCIRHGAKNCDSIKAAMPVDVMSLLLNWDLSRVVYACGFVLAVALLIPWGRITSIRFRNPVVFHPPAEPVPVAAIAIESPSPNTAIIESGGGFEFYPDRNSLPDTRRTRAQMEKAKDEICASWNTGQLVSRGEMLRIPNRKRISLPHPEKIGPYLAALEGTAPAMIAEQIKQLTELAWKTAQEENLTVEVRWLIKMPRNTVMLCDPQRKDGWAHVELLQPGVPEDLRPTLWFTKSRFPNLYDQVLAAFEKQWAYESVDPTWKAYFEIAGDRVLFNLTAGRPKTIQGARVTVTGPDTPVGALLPQAAQERLLDLQEDRDRVCFEYPRHFGGASAAKSGEWHVRWSVLISGAWREATNATHNICFPREG